MPAQNQISQKRYINALDTIRRYKRQQLTVPKFNGVLPTTLLRNAGISPNVYYILKGNGLIYGWDTPIKELKRITIKELKCIRLVGEKNFHEIAELYMRAKIKLKP